MHINKIESYNYSKNNNKRNFKAKYAKLERVKPIGQKSNLFDSAIAKVSGLLGLYCIVGVFGVALGTQKDRDEKVQNDIYNNMISQDSEGGMEITKNEKLYSQQALDFYNKNVQNKLLWGSFHHDKNLANFVKNATLPNSNEGMKITDKEKESYNYAQKNGLKIDEPFTINEKEADKNKPKNTTVIIPIPMD